MNKLLRLPAELAQQVADYLHEQKQSGHMPRSELSENAFFIRAIRFYLDYIRRTHDT